MSSHITTMRDKVQGAISQIEGGQTDLAIKTLLSVLQLLKLIDDLENNRT